MKQKLAVTSFAALALAAMLYWPPAKVAHAQTSAPAVFPLIEEVQTVSQCQLHGGDSALCVATDGMQYSYLGAKFVPVGGSGAVGPQGPAGPQGATGPQGPPGVSGVQTVNGHAGPNVVLGIQ